MLYILWLGYTKNVIFLRCNPNTSFGVLPVCLIILTETNCSPLNSRWRPISLTERFFDDCQKRIAVWAPSRLLRFFPCFHFFHLQTTISPWQGWVESDEQGKPLFYTVSIFPQCAQVSADGSSNHSSSAWTWKPAGFLWIYLPFMFFTLLFSFFVVKLRAGLSQSLLFAGSIKHL